MEKYVKRVDFESMQIVSKVDTIVCKFTILCLPYLFIFLN